MEERNLPPQLLITNARILDPAAEKEYAGEILLRNGKIEEVGRNLKADGAEKLDVGGKVVTHGFCDVHAHFREPGREDKETLATGSRAAIAGGFTTVCVMPNTDPPLDSPESIRFVLEKSEGLPIKIYPIGAVTVGQKGRDLSEMGAMFHAGAVAFSDDGQPVMDSGVMRRALEYSDQFGVPVINHAEDQNLKGDGQMNEGKWSTRLGLAGIPDVSESLMVSRDVQIAAYTRGKLHVPHISSRKSLEWIRVGKNQGVNVTAEVTPHHLYFQDSALQTYETNLKVAPPIRSEEDRKALITALGDGTLDCIGTDHAPHTIEEKEAPFDWAPCGMIALESAFAAVWKVLSEASFSVMDVLKMFTVKPRRIMGFETDLFRKGVPAELAILDPEVKWTFSADNIYSKSRNTPFLGETLRGKVCDVVSRKRILTMPAT